MKQVFLEFATEQNDKTFPSWREPLIKTDLSSGLDKVIPHQTPICRESFKKKSLNVSFKDLNQELMCILIRTQKYKA